MDVKLASMVVLGSVVMAGGGFGMGLVLRGEPSEDAGPMAGADLAKLEQDKTELSARLKSLNTEIEGLEQQLNLKIGGQPARVAKAQPRPETAAVDSSVLAARARLSKLQQELAMAKSGKLTDAEMAAKISEAKGRFALAVADRDADAAAKAMKELADLDERAFPELVAMWKEMEESNWLREREPEGEAGRGRGRGRRRGPGGRGNWASKPFFHWVLGESSLGLTSKMVEQLQSMAVMILSFMEADKGKLALTFSEFLGTLADPKELVEEEPKEPAQAGNRGRRGRRGGRRGRRGPWGNRYEGDLYRSTLSALSRIKAPKAAETLASVALNRNLPGDVRRMATRGLRGQEGPEVDSALSTLAADANEEVRSQAERANKMNQSPVSGVYVTRINQGSQAEQLGIPVGAIIVSFDGKPVTGERDLRRFSRETKKDTVVMGVYVNGTTLQKTINAKKRLGVDGDSVTARATQQ